MARPERHDADYFPFYAKDGKTLFILESKYQCKGTGFFTNVMRFLTLQKDHYFCVKAPEDRLYFFSKCKVDDVSGGDMLDMMAVTGKIDKDLWVSSAVIVSQDLLTSLSDAYRKRLNGIITISEIRQKYVSTGINGNSGGINKVKGGDNPQRKGKERKGKETKGKIEFIPPSLEDVKSFFQEKGYRQDIAQKAFDYYSASGWKDRNEKQVKNWKQKMIGVWFRDEHKVADQRPEAPQKTLEELIS